MKITLYVPISRPWAIHALFKMLDSMDIPRPIIELIVLIDTDDQEFVRRIQGKLKWLERNVKFGKIFSMATGKQPISEKAHIVERRQRIVENWELAKKMFGETEWFFGLEDDTICPNDAFWKLFNVFLINNNDLVNARKKVVYVEGVQAYRQEDAIGAWQIDYKNAWTLEVKNDGSDLINGGGFYCFLTKTDFVKKHKFETRDTVFAADVDFVHKLSYKGICLVRWDVQCGHLLEDGTVKFPVEGQLHYQKINDNWERMKT